MELIDKSVLVVEIERRITAYQKNFDKADNKIARLSTDGRMQSLKELLPFLDTLEVEDPYEQCVQYDSIKAGIQAHAETYSFNIESQLFPQLTKEQQALWRKEIEQAVISGGDAGVTLARDQRYKENLEVKEAGTIWHSFDEVLPQQGSDICVYWDRDEIITTGIWEESEKPKYASKWAYTSDLLNK